MRSVINHQWFIMIFFKSLSLSLSLSFCQTSPRLLSSSTSQGQIDIYNFSASNSDTYPHILLGHVVDHIYLVSVYVSILRIYRMSSSRALTPNTIVLILSLYTPLYIQSSSSSAQQEVELLNWPLSVALTLPFFSTNKKNVMI